MMLLISNGCAKENEKCVLIVDENNNKIVDAKVMFSSMLKRNENTFGNLVTTFSPFYKVNIVLTRQENNLICFENHKYKDAEYIYNDVRNWKIYNEHYISTFNSFESIPSKVILQTRVQNTVKYRLQLKDFNLTK